MDTILLGVGPTHISRNIELLSLSSAIHLCTNNSSRELVQGIEEKLNYLFGKGRH